MCNRRILICRFHIDEKRKNNPSHLLYSCCIMMLIRILNTLPSRIWDGLFFLFSDYSKSTVGEKGARRLGLSGKLNSLFLRNLNAILQKDTHFWGGGTPYFSYTKILTSFVAKEQKTGNLI